MRYYSLLIILALSSFSYAQKPIPRPFLYVGADLMGAGYSPLAFEGGVGFQIDSRRFLMDASAYYDNGHKTNDGVQPNPKGHDRGLIGSAYYRLPSNWFFGAGARWSQLSTTKYTKSAWRPTFGGGKDFFSNNCQPDNCVGQFSMRASVDYVMPGSDWQNGSQGPLLTLYMPSPSLKKHFFYRQTLGIYRFHDTVTDRTDPVLTRQQTGNHHGDSYLEFAIIYRF